MKSRHTMDFTTGSVPKKLLVFALPLICTNLLQHLYGAADSAVVGRFAGKLALAAVGSTTVATSFITNLLIGLAAGAGIINSNLRGLGDKIALRRSMHTGILVGAFFGTLFALVGILLAKPILMLLNCPADVIDSSATYLRIILCGTPGSIVYNFASGILRTHGDSKRPLLIISISGATNVVLNLIFVIFLKMAVVGVALATIISNYLSAFLVLRIVFDPVGEYKLTLKELKMHRYECLHILRVGIPCGINSVLFNISTAVVSASINTFGSTMIAASSASTNVSSLLTQIIGAFYTATMNFAGQCYGAGKYKRIDQVGIIATIITVSSLSVVSAIITSVPQFFIGIFNTDPKVIELGSQKLILMAWSFVLYALADMFLACLRGMKITVVPTVLNVFCICIVRVLWVIFVFPLNPTSYMLLYWCYPVSYFCNCIAMLWYYLHCRKKCFIPVKEVASI